MITAVPFRPLGLLKELLENHGFSVTHCYEDLVFVDHNAFLIQMGDKGEDVNLIFNADCKTDKRAEIEHSLTTAAPAFGLQLKTKGTYSFTSNEQDNTINIEFNR